MNIQLACGAAALAALATAGFVSNPATRLRRSVEHTAPAVERSVSPWSLDARSPGLAGLLRGRADSPALTRRLFASVLAAVAVAAALGGLGPPVGRIGWLLTPLLAAAATVLLGALEPLASRRRRQRLIMDAPAALELLAAALAAGLPPRNATAAVVSVFDGPVAEDLGSVLAAVGIGMSDAASWRRLRDHPALGEAAVDLARSVESGTMLVETLAHHARNARQRRHAAVEVAAKAVGVRCVLPMMICFIPAFLLLGIVPTVVSAFLAVVPAEFLGTP